MVEAQLVLAAFAATIVLGFLGQLFFRLTKISDILILMLFGVGLVALIPAIDRGPFLALAPVVGAFALLIILFEGGLDLHFRELVTGLARATLLAALGFVLGVAAVAAVAWYFLGLDPTVAVLLGVVLGGSSSIAVMPIVKRLAVHPKTRVVLSVESALTDILVVVGALTLVDIIVLGDRPEVESVGRAIGASFAIAILVGLAVAPVWLKLLDWMRNVGNIYMLTIASVFVLFLAVERLGGQGAIAVLVFGVVLGNARGLRRTLGLRGQGFGTDLRQFQSEVAFVVRAFFFVYLGIIFPMSALRIDFLIGALALVGALGVSRLAAVWISAFGSRAMRKDRGVWWVMMPRGLAAAVLAGVPMARGVEGAADFVAYVTLVIVLTNLLASLAGLFVRRGPEPVPERPVEFEAEGRGELYKIYDEQVNVPGAEDGEPAPAGRGVRSSGAGQEPDSGTPSRSRTGRPSSGQSRERTRSP